MFERKRFIEKIFRISSRGEFEEAAMELFRFQSINNPVYKRYLEHLGINGPNIKSICEIPCLPVSFFKSHQVITGKRKTVTVFKSSGTGGGRPSSHYVHDPGLYLSTLLECFRFYYGHPDKWCILALLPSYLERGNSSLVYMAGKLIERSPCPQSGFYLHNLDDLASVIEKLEKEDANILLIGVSFALVDLVENQNLSLKNTIIMETGGMKGRRKEITREELHEILISKTGLKKIHSEYGMTEMLSQAYSAGYGKFLSPPWMKIMIRDSHDPFTYVDAGKSGGINVIDLANVDSCAFLETYDLGRMLPSGEFEVLGRFDHSDIRGCNLLAE